jgi:hypothetical protein
MPDSYATFTGTGVGGTTGKFGRKKNREADKRTNKQLFEITTDEKA